MRILLITPAPPRTQYGNRVTALRWRGILTGLGHRVTVAEDFRGDEDADLLIALHARRSAAAVARFRAQRVSAPLVLALTGTDVYRDIHSSPQARDSIRHADRLVVLQPLAVEELPPQARDRTHVIHQSVEPISPVPPRGDVFEVAVLAHLRDVKDPFRAGAAARLLPAGSRIQITHLGGELQEGMADRARAEAAANARYRWLGERPRREALRVLARSRLLVLSSRLEGGANVVSEALAAGTPVLASRIPGSVGLLGEDYPGYFPVGDTQALADLLWRAETDPDLLTELHRRVEKLAPTVDPDRERAAWADLLVELHPAGTP